MPSELTSTRYNHPYHIPRTMPTLPEPHVRAWYWYAFAAEVFAACAMVRKRSACSARARARTACARPIEEGRDMRRRMQNAEYADIRPSSSPLRSSVSPPSTPAMQVAPSHRLGSCYVKGARADDRNGARDRVRGARLHAAMFA